MDRLPEIKMAEFTFGLLSEEESQAIEKRIREKISLAKQYGEWIDVAGNAVIPDWNMPVPDVLPSIHARLWGKKERKNYGWYYFAIGFSLVTVLVVKAYVLHGIWTNWPF